MTILLLGEAPARGTKVPFDGQSGDRLRKLLGTEFNRLRLMNLYQMSRARAGKGSEWNANAARKRAKQFVIPADFVLLAGRRVAAAFGIPKGVRYFEPCMVHDVVAYVIPHPSGVNQWWNVELNVQRAKNFFAAFFMAVDGVDMPDGSLDAAEFRVRAKVEARGRGRIY